jgi:hypothetical protein
MCDAHGCLRPRSAGGRVAAYTSYTVCAMADVRGVS